MAAPASSFLESLSPWGGSSRSATPKAAPAGGASSNESSTAPSPLLRGQQQGGDHRVSPRYRVSPKEYGPDCPALNVRWFYATDVHKRGPPPGGAHTTAEKNAGKPTPDPKKYAPFSARDSRAIELAFQKLAEDEDEKRGHQQHSRQPSETDRAVDAQRREDGAGAIGEKLNTSMDAADGSQETTSVKVPVNEDFLFDVDVDARELGPAYWLGPVYAVRRGTWFYAEGGGTRPCDENLATQVEAGYVKAKPWRNAAPPPTQQQQRNESGSRPRPASWAFGGEKAKTPSPVGRERKDSAAGNKPKEESKEPDKLGPEAAENPKQQQLQTHRLFGSHMNTVVTYQDANVAWLLTDDFYTRMSSTVYQRLAGGGHLGGVKLIRGYTDPDKGKSAKGEATATADATTDGQRGRVKPQHTKQPSGADASKTETVESESYRDESPDSESGLNPSEEQASTRKIIERQISQLSDLGRSISKEENAAAQEEEARRNEEKEIREDYKDSEGAEQDREIEHLVLVTHGIGQRLGLKMESLNFIHDVNVLRKSLKAIYEKSPDLQTLNGEVDTLPKNCRVQVLPVVWRHLLDFPHQSFKDNKEKDLSEESAFSEELGYPNLKDITVEGITPIRNLVEDLFLDILLYQSDYRDRIVHIIQKETNRIYKLFCDRNPKFHGKVSLVGHSLGSALFFDLLCHQDSSSGTEKQQSNRLQRSHSINKVESLNDLALDFEVEDFYCLGSPIGLFQMIKGKSISARHKPAASSQAALGTSEGAGTVATSSPKCKQLYNIFHPTDPVAYRIEPLISSAMKELKAQPLPYVKKGIFDVPGDGLSGIGNKVGQSVSGLWTSMTTGVASSLLNRSLGLQPAPAKDGNRGPQLLSLTGGPGAAASAQAAARVRASSHSHTASGSIDDADLLEHPPTLIDSKLETLYAGFQRRRSSQGDAQDGSSEEVSAEKAARSAAEERARSLRQEEAKIRALNANGRVDYSIQDLIGSIASHLSYWGDEDVNHFMVSQLLARQRVVKRDDQGSQDS